MFEIIDFEQARKKVVAYDTDWLMSGGRANLIGYYGNRYVLEVSDGMFFQVRSLPSLEHRQAQEREFGFKWHILEEKKDV